MYIIGKTTNILIDKIESQDPYENDTKTNQIYFSNSSTKYSLMNSNIITNNVEDEEKCCKKGFNMIGGLKNQINLIKELIELPLLRPDIFESFGNTIDK